MSNATKKQLLHLFFRDSQLRQPKDSYEIIQRMGEVLSLPTALTALDLTDADYDRIKAQHNHAA